MRRLSKLFLVLVLLLNDQVCLARILQDEFEHTFQQNRASGVHFQPPSKEFLDQEEKQKRSSYRLTVSSGRRDYDENIDGPRTIMNPRYVAHTIANPPPGKSIYDPVEPRAETLLRKEDFARQVDQALRSSPFGGSSGASNPLSKNDQGSSVGRAALSRAQEEQLMQQSSEESASLRSVLSTDPAAMSSMPPLSNGGDIGNTPPSIMATSVVADSGVRVSPSLEERLLQRLQDIVTERFQDIMKDRKSGIRYGRPAGSPPWGISEKALFTTPNLKIPPDILVKIGLRPIEDELRFLESTFTEALNDIKAAVAASPINPRQICQMLILADQAAERLEIEYPTAAAYASEALHLVGEAMNLGTYVVAGVAGATMGAVGGSVGAIACVGAACGVGGVYFGKKVIAEGVEALKPYLPNMEEQLVRLGFVDTPLEAASVINGVVRSVHFASLVGQGGTFAFFRRILPPQIISKVEASHPSGFRVLAKDYVRDMETRTGMKIGGDQRLILKETLQRYNFEKLDGESYVKHTTNFDRTTRNKLILEWEKHTGQVWPSKVVERDVGGKTERTTVKHQAHHVIPQELGGPHEWWNMHPAEGGKVHQGGVHRKSSPLSKLVEGAKKDGK
ncbi:MAG: hypothetical protein J0G29_06900 [Alphaproteobacteria bacterium]|nr:hypothetical protein [Alphaproteobacteria bacterium]